MQLKSLVGVLELGNPEIVRNLAFIRIFGDTILPLVPKTLDEALADDRFIVSERDPVRMNSLYVHNGLAEPVFVAAGMILEGRTQNRAVAYPALIGEQTVVEDFPVNCSQQGQPTRKGIRFTGSTTIVDASARSGAVNQRKTWDTITRTQARSPTRSPTKDYVEIARNLPLDEYLIAGLPLPRQLGYVAVVGNNGERSYFMDMFANHGLFVKLEKRLRQSVASVAVVNGNHDIKVERFDVTKFMESALSHEFTEHAHTPGAGRLYLAGEPIHGSALVYNGAPLQVGLRKDTYRDPRTDADITVFKRRS